MTLQHDAYAVLQVRPNADQEVIQAAYRALARRYHADGDRPDCARMIEINGAWERLRTPERRAEYDEARRQEPIAVGPGRGPGPTVIREPYDPWKNAAATRESNSHVIDFGRYAGWRIADLARQDPDYLRWLSRHSTGIRYLDAIAAHLPGDERVGRRTGLVG